MSRPFSIVFNFFRSLSLSHLERSLFSLSKQTVKPDDFIIYCNDVDVYPEIVSATVAKHFTPTPANRIKFIWDNHNEPSKRNASYAQNKSIQMAKNDLFIFTKADCIYHPEFCERLLRLKTDDPMEFIAPWLFQMDYASEKGKPHDQVDHAKDLEFLNWREDITRLSKVTGQLHNHAAHDAPSFCTTKQAMEMAGWYDESLRGWSLWQLDLQDNMQKRGIQIKVIPEVLSWHMMHPIPTEEGERDLQKAHAIYNASPRRKDPAFQ